MGWKRELWPEWEIEYDIGAGAFGTVYKIKRQDIGGTYYAALKVISFPHNKHELELMQNQNMTDDQISEYYHRMAVDIAKEFAVMERLKGNTNIVSYEDHKIVQHKNRLGWDVLIRMELLTPLPKYLETHAIDEKEVCRLGIDICNALILCEKENIIHRDIKPGNIFVSDFGDYKLGDFSLAKYMNLHMEDSSPKGTFVYMAPEVYREKVYDYTIDIYSLGLVLYRLLNRGRGPFQPLPPEIITLDMSERANRKRLQADVLPKPVDASSVMSSIILKACAGDPYQRFQSAKEFQKSLMRCSFSQSALKATKQMAILLKKAAGAFGDSSEERKEKNIEIDNVGRKEKMLLSGKCETEKDLEKSHPVPKKTMDDFFRSAGDL